MLTRAEPATGFEPAQMLGSRRSAVELYRPVRASIGIRTRTSWCPAASPIPPRRNGPCTGSLLAHIRPRVDGGYPTKPANDHDSWASSRAFSADVSTRASARTPSSKKPSLRAEITMLPPLWATVPYSPKFPGAVR